MTETVPTRFSAVVASVEQVCAELGAGGGWRPLARARWIRDATLTWEDVVRHVAFILDGETPLLAIYVILRVPEAAEHGDQLALALTRANYGLLQGCFELDLAEGQTRYRSVLWLYELDVDSETVARMFSEALVTSKRYARAFQAAVEDGADPIQAVDEVEE